VRSVINHANAFTLNDEEEFEEYEERISSYSRWL